MRGERSARQTVNLAGTAPLDVRLPDGDAPVITPGRRGTGDLVMPGARLRTPPSPACRPARRSRRQPATGGCEGSMCSVGEHDRPGRVPGMLWPVRPDHLEGLPYEVTEGAGRLRVDTESAAFGVDRRRRRPGCHLGVNLPGELLVRIRHSVPIDHMPLLNIIRCTAAQLPDIRT